MNERSILRLSGDDRISFLQGLLTQDVTRLAEARIQFAALLSPQGKLLHDMFLIDDGDGILIDTAAAYKDILLKRLNMYKLRAQVSLADVTGEWHITLGEGMPDPRHPELPHRLYQNVIPAKAGIHLHGSEMDSSFRWNDVTHRIALGIPEFGTDIQPDSMTAMDAGYDLLHAISFTKGCYVGQEVTARMHYKNIARKGFFIVASETPLIAGSPLLADDKQIGTITSTSGNQGLIFLKFDDYEPRNLTVDSAPVTLTAPGWMQPKLALFNSKDATQ